MAQGSTPGSSHYLSAIRLYPLLEREHEAALVQRWREQADWAARDLLLRAHLRLVVAIARRYRRHDATFDELVAEGNLGLLQALAKFDPAHGSRFASYAAYWIRAHISQHLLRSRTLVSSLGRPKLLGRLRRERTKAANLLGDGAATDAHLAERLGITPERLRALNERADLHDVPWAAIDFDKEQLDVIETLETKPLCAEARLLLLESEKKRRDAVLAVLAQLDDRERYVVERRLMADDEDKLSLAEIARRFGVSGERARQLETRAKLKVRAGLSAQL